MVLIDTSVWITILRDKSGTEAVRLRRWLDGREAALARFTQLELLQGCRDEREWRLLSDYLESQIYIEASTATWPTAARLFFDLRRKGLTVRSTLDCCIAQLAIEHGLILLHNDRDFEVIATCSTLQHLHWDRSP